MYHSGGGEEEPQRQQRRPSSRLASSEMTVLPESDCPSVGGADLPLPFQTPLLCLPQLLEGRPAERGLRAEWLLPAGRRVLCLPGHFSLPNAGLERKSRCSKGTSWKAKPPKAKRSQSPALVVFGTLRMLVPCEKSQFLLLPVDLSVGAGDSLANGQERPAVSSSQITWQFSIINSTSTFTCTHQSLAVNPGACKRARQPFPLLSLASAQKAVGVGLMFQAASPP